MSEAGPGVDTGHLGPPEECVWLLCAVEETPVKYSPWAGLAGGGSGRMQRKLKVGNNVRAECGSLKRGVSKMMEEIKVSWINSENQGLSGWDEISIKSRPRPGRGRNPAVLKP